MDIINKVKGIVADGKLDKAIKSLDENFKNYASYDEVVVLSSRLNSLNSKVIKGLINSENALVEENKIANSILMFLGSIEVEERDEIIKNADRKLDLISTVKKILQMLDKTKKDGFDAQVKLRNTLYHSMKRRFSNDGHRSFEEFFDAHYTEMSEEEKEFHLLIRSYTKEVLNKYNRKVLELILENEKLMEAIPELKR